MELYRVVPIDSVRNPSSFQWGKRLTTRRQHMAESLASQIEGNGYPITAEGKINGPNLPTDFYIIPHILHSVGAGPRQKHWKKFLRFLATSNIAENNLTTKVRSDVKKIK